MGKIFLPSNANSLPSRVRASLAGRPKPDTPYLTFDSASMSLNKLQLQNSYRTGRDDMVMGFFVPCLEQAVLYRRAAGYFTSHGLALAAKESAGRLFPRMPD